MDVSAPSVADVAVEDPGCMPLTTNKRSKKRKATPSVREFIPNLVTGDFLKLVFYLNPECSKYVIVGIFQNFGNCTDIILNGKKGFTYWSPIVFNEFQIYFNDVTLALDETKGVRRVGLLNGRGEDIVVKIVFGRRYAVLSDGNHSIYYSSVVTNWYNSDLLVQVPRGIISSIASLVNGDALTNSFNVKIYLKSTFRMFGL